jgi:hypothetical protein
LAMRSSEMCTRFFDPASAKPTNSPPLTVTFGCQKDTAFACRQCSQRALKVAFAFVLRF